MHIRSKFCVPLFIPLVHFFLSSSSSSSSLHGTARATNDKVDIRVGACKPLAREVGEEGSESAGVKSVHERGGEVLRDAIRDGTFSAKRRESDVGGEDKYSGTGNGPIKQ